MIKSRNSKLEKSICIIMPYFGKWPVWIDLFIETCKYNPTVDWLFFTDIRKPENKCRNVKFINMSFEEFNTLVSLKLGLDIHLSRPYKICDIRPSFGIIFKNYLYNYDFWGHGDIDIMFGNIRKYITCEILDNYEIISVAGKTGSKWTGCAKDMITGHFALYKNSEKINSLYTAVPGYEQIFINTNCSRFDELIIYKEVKKRKDIRLFEKPLGYGVNRFSGMFYWIKGKMYRDNTEIMFFHFWKWKNLFGNLDTCKIEFNNKEVPYGWYIKSDGFYKIKRLSEIRSIIKAENKKLMENSNKKLRLIKFLNDRITFDFIDQIKKYSNTQQHHARVWYHFKEKANQNEILKNHFDYLKKNNYGTGSQCSHYLLELLVKQMQDNFSFLEIGVFKGQIISLIQLLSNEMKKKVKIVGIMHSSLKREKYSIKKIYSHFGLTMSNTALATHCSDFSSIKEKINSFVPFDIVFINEYPNLNYDMIVEDLKQYCPMVKKSGMLVVANSTFFLDLYKEMFRGQKEVSEAVKNVIERNKDFIHLFACGQSRIWMKK